MPTATDVAPVVPSSRLRTTRRSATLAGRVAGRLPSPVQAAGRIALEVERDEPIAGGLDSDARDVTVMANAHLLEPEGFDRGLGRFDLAQRSNRDLGAVWDARRQACERRLVPVGQSELAGRGADLRLAHAGLEQRKPDAAADG